MSFFRRISSIRIKEEQKEEVEKENFDENEILPSRIVNPPIKPFRKKTQSYATFNLTPKRKTYSIHLLNKLEKQEEIAKVLNKFQYKKCIIILTMYFEGCLRVM